MALTDTEIRKARSTVRPYKLADSGGLFLLVMPSGGKLWRWKYRFGGKEKLMVLGSYPEVSLAKVRSCHAEGRSLLGEGKDPMEQRKSEKIAATVAVEHLFQKIAEEWHQHWSVGKSERHADAVSRRLKADVFPAIGSAPIAGFTLAYPTFRGIVPLIRTLLQRRLIPHLHVHSRTPN